MEKQNKKKDILEGIKEIDKEARTKMVYVKLKTLKEWARTILELKEKTQIMLEELGVETEDIKRLIDYVNSTQELTEKDKKELREEIKDDVEEEKEEVTEKLIKDLEKKHFNQAYTMTASAGTATTSLNDYATTWKSTDNMGTAYTANYSLSDGTVPDFQVK
jgi:hypothetical protein